MNALKWVLGVLFIFVSILSMITFVNKLNERRGDIFLTGAAVSSDTGQTNITITQTTSLTLGSSQINFGSGRVNASCDFCVIDSLADANLSIYANGSNIGHTNCCVGFTYPMKGFLLENTGNVNVSVGYTCSGNCTHALFIGGTRAASMGGIGIKLTDNYARGQAGEQGGLDTSRSCFDVVGSPGHNGDAWNISNTTSGTYPYAPRTYVPLSPQGHWLCGNYTLFPLSYYNTEDAGVMDINVTIPQDAPATGVRSSFMLTFNATSG